MQLLWRKAVLLLVGATLMELAMSQGVQDKISVYTYTQNTDCLVRYVANPLRGQMLARRQLATCRTGVDLQHKRRSA